MATAAHPLTPAAASRAKASAFLALFCCGLWVTSFGPALPFIAREANVGLGTAGFVLTAVAGGSISASALVSLRLGRVDSRLLIALGLGVASLGLAALAVAPSFALMLLAAVLLGTGDGLVVAATHALVTIVGDDVPRAINRLNVFFALGAIVGPLWAGASLSLTDDITLTYAGLAVAVLACGAFCWRTPRAGAAGEEHLVITINRSVAVMGLVLFCYVGAEIGLGAWVSSYTERVAEAGVMAGALVTCGYWGALAIGRVATGRLLQSHDAARLLALAIAAAGASGLVLAIFGDVLAVAFAAAFVTGLAFGPIWPLSMAIGVHEGTTSTTAAMVTIGNSGALVFPVIQGAVLASAGPREGVAVTPALCAMMLTFMFVHARASRGMPLAHADTIGG
ncbi:MAG: MFS transporter [Chloroflexota bacterium]